MTTSTDHGLQMLLPSCFDYFDIFGLRIWVGWKWNVWPEIRKCSKVGTALYSFLWRKTMSEMYKVKFE